jgi:hypothetical protein
MAKDGLLGTVCAGAVVLALAPVPFLHATGEDRGNAVLASLAVQKALQQGCDHLQHGDARSAVYVLEGQLSQINGNPAYLALLANAYRTYIKELKQNNQEGDAQRYQQRLQVLDPGAAIDEPARRAAAPPVPAAKAEPKVRLLAEDEKQTEAKQKTAVGLLARAEQEFAARHYREAAALFEQAHQADQNSTRDSRERWAYCKLARIVEQLNQPSGNAASLQELEGEVRSAQQLAPRLDYARVVLGEIEKRRGTVGPVISVQHFERASDGWARVETKNFRVFHNQSRELAEQTARVAEKTRSEMGQKWFGGLKEDWNPRCDIFLHATSRDYSRVTGVATNSPGHSSIRSEGSRVTGRRIDLHCDDTPNMLAAVLPHEATHVVLAGNVGEQAVPRWADEGIAVLTEPREKIDRHLKNLVRCKQENGLFSVRQLITLNDYPEPRQISAFYAMSVSLVEFLSTQKGPQVLPQFLREAPKIGWEQALTKYYGFRNFDELQQSWSRQAFAAAEGNSGVAQARP